MPAATTTTMPLRQAASTACGERVEPVVLHAVGAEGQVEHPDVQAGVVAVLHDPVDGGDDLGDVDGAVGGGHLDVDDAGVGGDADEVLVVVLVAGRHVVSRPAMMPAMCVPWPKASRWRRSAACDSNDRSGPLTTFAGSSSPATGATPVSIRATSTPRPSPWS